MITFTNNTEQKNNNTMNKNSAKNNLGFKNFLSSVYDKYFNRGSSNMELKEALKKCREVASDGFKFTTEYFDEFETVLKECEDKLKAIIKNFENSNLKDKSEKENFLNQLYLVQKYNAELKNIIQRDLIDRKHKLDKFSITLFGRTMAGKSTLMEILTNGTGESIGKGAQRTTRDVRAYKWNGLEVVDVPGIAAFEGQIDEELAYKSAMQADLVLFLITDDAPQDEEAKCLAKILELGKPVLGICNLKRNLVGVQLKKFLRGSICADEETRINELIKQFFQLLDQYYPGKTIPFVLTHLNSRFLANTNDYAQYRDELVEKSNFAVVENFIVDNIINNGIFMRKKNFIDAVSVPMLKIKEMLGGNIIRNIKGIKSIEETIKEVNVWRNKFYSRIRGNSRYSDSKINSFVNRITDNLSSKFYNFVDIHYNDENVGEAWNEIVKNENIDVKSNDLCKEINNECNNALKKYAKDLNNNINYINSYYSNSSNLRIATFFITPKTKSIIEYSCLAGSLVCACIGLTGVGTVIGIAGLVFNVWDWLTGASDQKIKEAKKELRGKLDNNVKEIENKICDNLNNWFNDTQCKKIIDFIRQLENLHKQLLIINNWQYDTCRKLNKKYKEMTVAYIKHALDFVGESELAANVIDAARIHNRAVFIAFEYNNVLLWESIEKLKSLLGEEIYWRGNISDYGEDKLTLFVDIAGCEVMTKALTDNSIEITNWKNLNEECRLKVQLAEQICELNVEI